MAPRHQMAAAIGLTVLGLLFSLMTHVVGQHLGGTERFLERSPGPLDVGHGGTQASAAFGRSEL